MTAKRGNSYIRPFVLLDGYEKRMSRAPSNVANRMQRIGRAALSVITLPLRALFCGLLLPLVVVESATSLTGRRGAAGVTRFVRAVGRTGPQNPARVAVAPFPDPAVESTGMPDMGFSLPAAARPPVVAKIRADHEVIPAAKAAFWLPVTFPLRALFCGLLLPLVVAESAISLTGRRSPAGVTRLVRTVAGTTTQSPARVAVAPFPYPAVESPDMPEMEISLPKTTRPSVFAKKRAVHVVVPAAKAAFMHPVALPLRALFGGLLLPLVVVESAISLTGRRNPAGVTRLVRAVAGIARQTSAKVAVAPSPGPAIEHPDMPDLEISLPTAAKPLVIAGTRAADDVIPTAEASSKPPAVLPLQAAGGGKMVAARAVAAGLLSARMVLERLWFWTFVRPAHSARSMAVRLTRAVGHRFRKTILTISIEDAVVRMVVFRGEQVVAWKSAWIGDEFGPLGGAGADHAGELGDRVTPSLLRRVIKGAERGHRRVVVDLPAYMSLIRNLTMNKMGRRYLSPIVESEILESVPFSKNDVDLSWCFRPISGQDDDRLEVFALAVPKEKMETTARLLSESGIQPSAAYAKSTTLAYAAGVSNSVLIHFEGNTAAIIRVRDGEPRVVHQLTCPRDHSNPRAAHSALAKGVEQVEGFSPGLVGAGDLEAGDSLAPVVLSGDIFGAGIDPRALADVFQAPVSTVQTSLDHPPGFPAAQYASNIGLFLADRAGIGPWEAASRKAPARHTSPKIPPALNVLPKRHMPPPRPVMPVLIFLALFLTAGGIVPFSGMVNTLVGNANALEDQLESLQGQAKHRRSLVEQELELSGKLQATSDEAGALESRLEEIKFDMRILLEQLDAITYDPQAHGVTLFGVNPETNGFSITGVAETHDDVLRYTQTVRNSGYFGDARVTGLEGLGKKAGGSITFRILVTEPGAPQDADVQASSPAARK